MVSTHTYRTGHVMFVALFSGVIVTIVAVPRLLFNLSSFTVVHVPLLSPVYCRVPTSPGSRYRYSR